MAAFWSEVETNSQPEFDRLDSEFYALEDADSLWHPFARYVWQHPEEFVHSRIKS